MIIEEIEKFVRDKSSGSFVEQHIKFVVKHALELCEHYPEADKEVVEISVWLHDIVHPTSGYTEKDHNIASAKVARIFLEQTNLDADRIEKIIHCIEAHRTSQPPEPETIEAKIVASADNISHFSNFDFLVEKMGIDLAKNKIQMDLHVKFMLPEAIEMAKEFVKQIENKYNIKVFE